MRHRNTLKKMGRTSSHRSATLRNLASALIEHKQIRTTLSKAKAAQGYVDRLVGYGKDNSVHARRLAFKLLQSRTLVKTLFDEIAPEFKSRNGGYTRVIKLGMRRGDGAPLAMLQLVGFEPFKFGEEAPAAKSTKKGKPKAKAAAATAAAEAAETAAEDVKDTAAEAIEAAEEAVEKAEEAVETKKETPRKTATKKSPGKSKTAKKADSDASEEASGDKDEEKKDD